MITQERQKNCGYFVIFCGLLRIYYLYLLIKRKKLNIAGPKSFYFILKADEDGLDADREDDQDDDESSNQGDNAFAWPTNNSYDEQRLVLTSLISF